MDTNKKKIMVVEDDEHISKVYEIKFAKEGIDVSLARDGEEAIVKITAEKPDVILLDLMIPKKDGFGVLEEIKKNPELANIPVIILSNLGQKTDQDRALALGANEYLVKVDYSIQDVINKAMGYLG
ncbi:MAG: Response regulator receiver protein [Parcubacteria group bacterium GW2011_GWC1_42_11]|uniref:Response regulator receiver protein n=1 Tax=Candidatus Nomurabacteria bacterium GW2011_GWC2_42_20 TaxID=1618756 RepID=A0A0G0ZF61_9BACT|nr:MAG: Response regulator receiver protein [Parcubacteria group bacterium GW2011_GWC1_42_11]KKS47362.1 MAG: Response regulator receiver protein [Candidatus Nomurabacteria bacterium GW2011_GWC2_42_20]KKT09337.1 MAG: Response regulator receiver protein [Candidatus Nomurabacteria bacterium GW2011_GWB1_43_20]TAN35754.1 MAG: response regulator [Patescibacteria group bacterium]HBH71574.1 response regulator [Candidatus Yonathbacteria bacterium]